MAALHVLVNAVDPFDEEPLPPFDHFENFVRRGPGVVTVRDHHHVALLDPHDAFFPNQSRVPSRVTRMN
jgi:hypothetical protein